MYICGLTVPKDYSLSSIGVTQGLIKTYLTCQLKYLYSINRLYVPGGAGRTTGFGTMFHYVLEQTYKMWSNHKQLPSAKDISGWLDKCTSDSPEDFAGDNDVEMEKTIIETMIPAYLRFYSSDFKRIEIVGIEEELAVLLDPFVLRGKIDLLFRIGKELYTRDYKTHSRINEATMNLTLAFDYQHLFYTKCVELIRGENVKGSYHDVIRNPKYDFKGSFDECRHRLEQELRTRPQHFFKRFIINFSKEDKERHTKELLNVLYEIQERLEGKRMFLHNPNACAGYSTCQFLEACSSGKLTGYKRGDEYFHELSHPLKEVVNGTSSRNEARHTGRPAGQARLVKNKRITRVQ